MNNGSVTPYLCWRSTLGDMQRTERDMIPLLWEGFARVVHNSRKNGYVKLNGDVPNCLIRRYEVVRPIPGDFVRMHMVISFEYNRALNEGKVVVSHRDARRLWSML